MAGGAPGKLKIFMGYAAGVGKTYRMLVEAHELKARGVDVVVGYFEPHGRADTIAKAEGLEVVPRARIAYRGSVFEEMDTPAILARRPHTAAVDEFPHSNVPGAARAKRWEDVQALLNAGIDVLTTMNIQHLESLNDEIRRLTGIQVRETVPDWIVEQADEVIMVDLTPRALLHRLERGAVYGRDKAERAMQNFFRESKLVALRELALRQAAHEVGHRMRGPFPRKHHRILVYVTADPRSAGLIRRARRVSDFLESECFAAAVERPAAEGAHGERERKATDRHLNFARDLHLETRILEGEDPAATLVEFARRNGITQIFLSRAPRRKWFPWFPRDFVHRIVAQAKDMQIVVVADALDRP